MTVFCILFWIYLMTKYLLFVKRYYLMDLCPSVIVGLYIFNWLNSYQQLINWLLIINIMMSQISYWTKRLHTYKARQIHAWLVLSLIQQLCSSVIIFPIENVINAFVCAGLCGDFTSHWSSCWMWSVGLSGWMVGLSSRLQALFIDTSLTLMTEPIRTSSDIDQPG